MLLLTICILWAGLVACLLGRAVRQYGDYEVIQPMPPPDRDEAPSVAIIIPARNERQNIARCLEGLCEQTYPRDRLRIVVVDDRSTDTTAFVVSDYRRRDARIELLRGRSLPEGWTGKTYACHQGVHSHWGMWVCFIDADTRPGPDLLSSAMHTVTARRIDMLSIEPAQEMRGFWERIVLSAGFLLLAFFLDIRKINDPDRPEATANGQFLLIRRSVYEAVGGHAAVKDRIAEDGALAQRVKRARYRLALLGGETLIRVRMYRDLRSLWEGLTKNVVDMVGGVPRSIGAGVGALLLGWLPLILPLLAGMHLARAPGSSMVAATSIATATTLTLLGVHIAGARRFRIPVGYGVGFPVGYSVCGALALTSAIKRWRGQVTWKGRTYGGAGRTRSRIDQPADVVDNR